MVDADHAECRALVALQRHRNRRFVKGCRDVVHGDRVVGVRPSIISPSIELMNGGIGDREGERLTYQHSRRK